jgi:hypothetical protein
VSEGGVRYRFGRVKASLDLLRPSRSRFAPVRARRRLALAVLAASAAVAFGLASARSPRAATIPTIYVEYTTDCTFTMSADGGIAITSTTAPAVVLPPGPYQVVVSQAYALSPGAPRCPPSTYELTGPGVNLSFVVGEGSPYEEATETFPPSSTYVAAVANQPLVQLVFSTASSGSSSSLLAPAQGAAPAGQGQVQPGLVGSAIPALAGRLQATVDAAGKAALSSHGRSVASLKAGAYELTVEDEDTRAGFTVQKLHQHPLALSGPSFVGRKTRRLELTPGTWIYYAGASPARRFLVVA